MGFHVPVPVIPGVRADCSLLTGLRGGLGRKASLLPYTTEKTVMKAVLARSLSRKQIMTNDGKAIGELRNLMVDLDTGQLTDLVIEPDESFDTTGYQMDGDRMLVPFESVRDIKDFIVVDRYLAKM